MSPFTFFLFCLNPLIIQKVSSEYVKRRNTLDPVIASGMPIRLYSDIDMLPFPDPCYTVPMIYVPDQPYAPEYARHVCERRQIDCPDYHMPAALCGGFDNCAMQSAVAEENVVEASAITPSPQTKAVSFGGDTLALALSPLLEAADADVALLMFTKFKSC